MRCTISQSQVIPRNKLHLLKRTLSFKEDILSVWFYSLIVVIILTLGAVAVFIIELTTNEDDLTFQILTFSSCFFFVLLGIVVIHRQFEKRMVGTYVFKDELPTYEVLKRLQRRKKLDRKYPKTNDESPSNAGYNNHALSLDAESGVFSISSSIDRAHSSDNARNVESQSVLPSYDEAYQYPNVLIEDDATLEIAVEVDFIRTLSIKTNKKGASSTKISFVRNKKQIQQSTNSDEIQQN